MVVHTCVIHIYVLGAWGLRYYLNCAIRRVGVVHKTEFWMILHPAFWMVS